MMKVEVIEPCIDRYTGEFYRIGHILTVTADRAKEMNGFIRVIEKDTAAKKTGRKPKG